MPWLGDTNINIDEPEHVSYKIKLSYYRQLVIDLAYLGFNTIYTILFAITIIFTNSLFVWSLDLNSSLDKNFLKLIVVIQQKTYFVIFDLKKIFCNSSKSYKSIAGRWSLTTTFSKFKPQNKRKLLTATACQTRHATKTFTWRKSVLQFP